MFNFDKSIIRSPAMALVLSRRLYKMCLDVTETPCSRLEPEELTSVASLRGVAVLLALGHAEIDLALVVAVERGQALFVRV